MKKHPTLLSGVIALIALGAALLVKHDRATAQCTPSNTGTGGPDTIQCNIPLTGDVNANDGDDSINLNGSPSGSDVFGGNGADLITNSGNFSNSSGIGANDGNDTIINIGNFSGTSAILSDNGNDSIVNSGNFSNGSYIFDSDGSNTLINSGNFANNSFITTQFGNTTIINSGDFSNFAGISGATGALVIINSGDFSNFAGIVASSTNDTISNSGAFSNGSAISGDAGNDTITLLPGSAFDATSFVDGDALSFITGNSDLLILYSPVEIAIPNLSLCQGNTGITFGANSMQAAGCFIPWEGGVLYFTNFEKIQVILLQVLAAQGISVDIPAGPQVICDDGRVKVFKLPNGDVEYYSGFDRVNVPNGFMVARVSLLDLANGVRTFPTSTQTPNPLGWRVVITQTGNTLSGQVVDADGNAVGNSCRH